MPSFTQTLLYLDYVVQSASHVPNRIGLDFKSPGDLKGLQTVIGSTYSPPPAPQFHSQLVHAWLCREPKVCSPTDTSYWRFCTWEDLQADQLLWVKLFGFFHLVLHSGLNGNIRAFLNREMFASLLEKFAAFDQGRSHEKVKLWYFWLKLDWLLVAFFRWWSIKKMKIQMKFLSFYLWKSWIRSRPQNAIRKRSHLWHGGGAPPPKVWNTFFWWIPAALQKLCPGTADQME